VGEDEAQLGGLSGRADQLRLCMAAVKLVRPWWWRSLRDLGRLWHEQAPDAIDYAKFYSRSHDSVIRVYDEAGNVIDIRF
jgi:hypothetical protein